MKQRYIAFAAVGVAFVLTACDTNAPTTIQSNASAASNAVESKTTGEGTAQLPAGFTTMAFAFSARVKADGSASGHFTEKYASANGVVDFDGEVTCVGFDPVNNRAWVGGVITRNGSTNPAMQTAIHQVGRDVWFRVVDNGEGSGAANDRTTVFGFTGAAGITTSAQYCAVKPWAAGDANTWAVIEGNIQVKP